MYHASEKESYGTGRDGTGNFTKEKIAETARKCGFDNIIMTESLEEAVKVCAENAESGDAVLLSPACASWGDFKDYTQRGELFRQYVMELPE